MEQFASGWKRNYYGKGDVIVYRLNRDGRRAGRQQPGLRRQRADAPLRRRVLADLHDRRQHRPHRHRLDEELHPARDAELRRRRPRRATAGSWRAKFLAIYPQVEGVQVSAVEIPYAGLARRGATFAPAGPERATARVELNRGGRRRGRLRASAASGCCGWAAARSTASCATSTRRCRTSTNRPLHMWLDLEWRYTDAGADVAAGGA